MAALAHLLRPAACTAALLLALPLPLAAAEPTPYRVNGAVLAVTARPESPVVALGEPTWVVLRIENRSSTPFVFSPLSAEGAAGLSWSPNAALVQVESTDGRAVGVPLRPMGFGGSFAGPRPITIAPGDVSEHRYFLPVWAKLDEPGTYRIHIHRRINLGTGRTPGVEPEVLLIAASTEIQVTPANPARLGERIAALGEAALRERDRDGFQAPAAELYAIADERTIPYLRRLITESGPGDNGPVLQAFAALAKFDGDEALAIIRSGMEFKVANLSPRMQGLGDAARFVDNVRNSAANALANSSHPGAFATLASYRNDPSSAVRNQLVRAAFSRVPDVGVPVLRDLADDPERSVGAEAARLIAVMTAPGFVSAPEAARLPPVRRRDHELIVRYDARPADLARFKDEKGITTLSFTRDGAGPFTYLSERDLALLAGWSELTTLDLGPIALTDAAIAPLSRLPKLEFSLRTALGANWLTAAGLAEAAARMPGLIELDLQGLSEAAQAQLFSTTRLRRLTLSRTATDATLAGFQGNAGLEYLYLGRTQVTDAAMATVGRFLRLQSLALWELPVTEAGIARLGGLTQLRSFSYGRLTDAGLATLSRLANLEDLQLANSPLTDAALPSLARLTKLKTLWVPGSALTRLPDNLRELASIDLNRTKVGDAAVLALSNLPKLTSLTLQATPISDAALARLPELKELTRLDLNGTGITDASMDAVAQLPKLSNLDLRNTRVTAAGLAKLAGLKSLTILNQNAVPDPSVLIPSLRR